MRCGKDLFVPNYLKNIAHKSFVYVAAKEYNQINKFVKEKKLSTNNFINNVFKFYKK